MTTDEKSGMKFLGLNSLRYEDKELWREGWIQLVLIGFFPRRSL